MSNDQLSDLRTKLLNDQKGGQPQPEASQPREQVAPPSDRLTKLVQAAERAAGARRAKLPDLSDAYGAVVEVEVMPMNANELIAGGMLPGDTQKVVSAFIKRSEDITSIHRDKVGMMDMAQSIADEKFDGNTMQVFGSLMQMTRAVACLGVKGFYFNGEPNEPHIRLGMDRETPNTLYIGLLSDTDLNIIAGAVWSLTEEAAEEAEAFPDTGNTADAASPVQAHAPAAERADGV